MYCCVIPFQFLTSVKITWIYGICAEFLLRRNVSVLLYKMILVSWGLILANFKIWWFWSLILDIKQNLKHFNLKLWLSTSLRIFKLLTHWMWLDLYTKALLPEDRILFIFFTFNLRISKWVHFLVGIWEPKMQINEHYLKINIGKTLESHCCLGKALGFKAGILKSR